VLAALLVLTGCEVAGRRAPSGLSLSAATDSTVRLVWAEPAEGTPDGYLVYFRPARESLFGLVAEPETAGFEHFPAGRCGAYRIAARFGAETYAADAMLSTMPIRTDTTALAELNAAGNSGYGWNRGSGQGRTCSMRDVASAATADFYITDFKPAQFTQPPYSVAGAHMGQSDPGAVVPLGGWREVLITDPLDSAQGPLPGSREAVYYDFGDITRQPCYFGCFTADSHYALVEVVAVDTARRAARVVTWFQLVSGLRLIFH
jgi:hypothetical protein